MEEICSIADVFAALTSERTFRQKRDTSDALNLMKEEMIRHFQRELFEQSVLFSNNSMTGNIALCH